ncbi:5-hydroxyisourate hydrolase [Saccharothrix ecbatanensis]|uniref:5-hydroxyisourate hydrolase n=1 Tax=Saccharothrix ecbatanensis TaxID=1105145 RepID=A0A7W9HN72_9PSEU|nr:hydroxyisourate hydrolase [Saccharothrix ecbatanensis]MBB5805357.1 5-hydroxyisourate hydrolase [Saccharothrix ecbatanensis]
MTTLSTHVLDAEAGGPKVGVPVRLERDGEVLAGGVTDDDGRLRFGEDLAAGVHRLVFEVDTPFYPEITIAFRVADDGPGHLHVPILLSPFAFTTYRGS